MKWYEFYYFREGPKDLQIHHISNTSQNFTTSQNTSHHEGERKRRQWIVAFTRPFTPFLGFDRTNRVRILVLMMTSQRTLIHAVLDADVDTHSSVRQTSLRRRLFRASAARRCASSSLPIGAWTPWFCPPVGAREGWHDFQRHHDPHG